MYVFGSLLPFATPASLQALDVRGEYICMFVYVYIPIYIYVYTYVYVYMSLYLSLSIYIYRYMYNTYIYIYIYLCEGETFGFLPPQKKFRSGGAHTPYIYIYVHVLGYHVYIYIYIYKHDVIAIIMFNIHSNSPQQNSFTLEAHVR